MALDPGPFLFTGVFSCPAYISLGLHTLEVDIQHLRPPLLCSSIVNLSVSIRQDGTGNPAPFYHPCLSSVSTILRTAPYLIPGLRTLRIDGDECLEEFAEDISIFCELLENLVSIQLSPYAMSRRLLLVLSRLPRLQSLRLLEAGQDGNIRPARDVAYISLPVPELEAESFSCARELALSTWSPSLSSALILRPATLAINLKTLWFRYSAMYPVVAEEVRYLLYTFALACPNLEVLTMRFASYGWDMKQDSVMEPLTLHHLRLFYAIRSLVHFAIDHPFPIHLTAADLQEIAANCGRFKSLFLNPYPSWHTQDVLVNLPPIDALEPFASLCLGLERLGVLVDASTTPLDSSCPPKFVSLQELHVGWSLIAGSAGFSVVDSRWSALAAYVSWMFSDGTQLKTIHGGRREDDASMMMLAPMRARGKIATEFDPLSRYRSLAWSVVWAMAMSLREVRRWEREGVRDGFVHDGGRLGVGICL